ncbi:MAG: hypothetical protein Q4G13_00505 [Moraxella sp.]|nr:hypothetical protein [Moraxella sp.]
MTRTPLAPTLDPKLLDITWLAARYLHDLPVLLAHQLHLSIPKVRLAISHSIAVSTLQLMREPSPPIYQAKLQHSLQQPFAMHSLDKISADKASHVFFAHAEDTICQHIASLSTLTHKQAITIMGTVAALLQQYIAHISTHAGLTEDEYRTWLDLQMLFVDSDVSLTWCKTLAIIPNPPTISHSSYQHKLGKAINTPIFDNTQYPVPNVQWLIKLAMLIDQHHLTPLTLGKSLPIIALPPPKTVATSAVPQKPKKLMLIGTLTAVVIGVGASMIWYNWQPRDTTPTNTSPTQETPPQDIAIIRIDDETADDSDDNGNDGASDTAKIDTTDKANDIDSDKPKTNKKP